MRIIKYSIDPETNYGKIQLGKQEIRYITRTNCAKLKAGLDWILDELNKNSNAKSAQYLPKKC